MSLINGNLFQGSEFYIIGRDSGRYYTFARLNDGDKLRQRDLWISDSPSHPSQPTKTKFYTFRVSGEKNSIIESYLDDKKIEVPLFYNDDKGVGSSGIILLGSLQVPEKINKLDSGLYHGVWYDVHSYINDKVSVKLTNKLAAAPLTGGVFPGFVDDIIDYSKSLQITFIPLYGSLFHEGICTRLLKNEPMKYFTKYVGGEIESSGCDDLTKNSQNCIFSDMECHNLIGFRLAREFEKCGKRVYGPCDKGICAYNGKKFLCVDSDTETLPPPESKEVESGHYVIFIVIMFAITLILFFIFMRR